MTSGLKRKTDLCELGSSDLSSAFRSGELSPKEVVKAALDRAEKKPRPRSTPLRISIGRALSRLRVRAKCAGESKDRCPTSTVCRQP